MHWTRQTWTRRRTDRTIFHDERRVSWISTFEIEIPDVARLTERGLYGASPPDLPLIVPLILKAKALLTVFSLTRDAALPTPTLTTAERTLLTELTIIAAATRAIQRESTLRGTELTPFVTKQLRALAGPELGAVNAQKKLHGLAEEARGNGTKCCTDQRLAKALEDDTSMSGLLQELPRNYLVLVPMSANAGDRVVLELRHDETIEDSMALTLRCGYAGAYHAELRLPSGMRFRPGCPQVEVKPREVKPGEVKEGPIPLPSKPGIVTTKDGEWRREAEHEELLALYASASHREATMKVSLAGALRTAAGGLEDRARQVAVLAVAMLLTGSGLRLVGVHPIAVASAPLLAALPGAAAALALQTSDVRVHALVARSARDVLVAVLLVTLIAAVLLSVDFPRGKPPLVSAIGWGWRGFAWATVTVVAIVMRWWAYHQTDSDWRVTAWLGRLISRGLGHEGSPNRRFEGGHEVVDSARDA